jgi:hypothetical protein
MIFDLQQSKGLDVLFKSSCQHIYNEEIQDINVSIGSDVAFAMVVGTGKRAVFQWWIGRIAKLLKRKGLWRRAVPLSEALLDAGMSAE